MKWLIFFSFSSLLKQQFINPPGLHQLRDLVEGGEEVDLVSGCESVGMLVRKTPGIPRLLYFLFSEIPHLERDKSFRQLV